MVCPLPSIVKLPGEVFAIAGRVLPSVIAPLTLKFMVSVPVPAAQLVEPDWFWLLALAIAARRSQVPAGPGSLGLLNPAGYREAAVAAGIAIFFSIMIFAMGGIRSCSQSRFSIVVL